MDTDLDTLAVALYVRIDDLLKDHPELVPWRPKIGIAPKLADSELLTLAVLQVLLGFNEEARRVRHARTHLGHLFPYVPGQAGYNKRLRKSTVMLSALIRLLGQDVDVWQDDTWLIDSTEIASEPTVRTSKRSSGSRAVRWAMSSRTNTSNLHKSAGDGLWTDDVESSSHGGEESRTSCCLRVIP